MGELPPPEFIQRARQRDTTPGNCPKPTPPATRQPGTNGKSDTRPMPPHLLENRQQTQNASAIADAMKNK